MPLVSSFMLSTKPGKEAWVEPVLDPAARDGYRFEIRSGKADPATLEKAKKGTKSSRGANFVCVLTGTPITPAHIKAEGKAKRMGARLMAIVAEGIRGRIYLPPDDEHERIAASAKPTWAPEQATADEPACGSVPSDYGLTTFARPVHPAAVGSADDLLRSGAGGAGEGARGRQGRRHGRRPDPARRGRHRRPSLR